MDLSHGERVAVGFLTLITLGAVFCVGALLYLAIGWWALALPLLPGVFYLIGFGTEKTWDALKARRLR